MQIDISGPYSTLYIEIMQQLKTETRLGVADALQVKLTLREDIDRYPTKERLRKEKVLAKCRKLLGIAQHPTKEVDIREEYFKDYDDLGRLLTNLERMAELKTTGANIHKLNNVRTAIGLEREMLNGTKKYEDLKPEHAKRLTESIAEIVEEYNISIFEL